MILKEYTIITGRIFEVKNSRQELEHDFIDFLFQISTTEKVYHKWIWSRRHEETEKQSKQREQNELKIYQGKSIQMINLEWDY